MCLIPSRFIFSSRRCVRVAERGQSVPTLAARTPHLAKPCALIVSQRGGAIVVYLPGEGAAAQLSMIDSVIANCSAVGQELWVRARYIDWFWMR